MDCQCDRALCGRDAARRALDARLPRRCGSRQTSVELRHIFHTLRGIAAEPRGHSVRSAFRLPVVVDGTVIKGEQ